MLYQHSVENCFSRNIGPLGLDDGDFVKNLEAAQKGLDFIRARFNDGQLPVLRLPKEKADVEALEGIAQDWRNKFDRVAILGTGGSSLGGQSLYALADAGFGPPAGIPKLYFLDNVDPHTFDAFLAAGDLRKTGFLVISKSGGTAETMCQFLIAVQHFRNALGDAEIAKHFLVITEPKQNVLRRFAQEWKLQCLDHDPLVGGRFSVFSLVGLLPAMIAGLDVLAIRKGAEEVLSQALAADSPLDSAPAVGAAISIGLFRSRNISTTVLMPYIDRLTYFGMWYRQLWAESLGKDGQGTTPIRAMGTVDQHSQLQLYLAGPKDKMFTVVMAAAAATGGLVDPTLAHDKELSYLAGHSMGDLLDVEQRATSETLIRNGKPTRLLMIESLDEATMGALMMHFVLETIIAAQILGINAFDQPAVEEGKILAKEYLATMRER